MKPSLAFLLAVAVPAVSAAAPAVLLEGAAGDPPRLLSNPAEVTALCEALVPAERLRPRGDALDRGDAEARHEAARDATLRRRYEVRVPAAKLGFAPYEGAERRLALADPVTLVLAPRVRLWPTEARALPVEVDARGARRILEAQRAGRLALAVAFDLPDDATCNPDLRPPRGAALPIEPVEWSWRDGEVVLARGGAGADRPLASAAEGARPRVDVGVPLAGPPEARKTVLAHRGDLEACYRETLDRDPGVDGMMVVEVTPARPLAVAADSTGAPELAACVQQALQPLFPQEGGAVTVPIRFELQAPAAGK